MRPVLRQPGRRYALGWDTSRPGQLAHNGEWFSHTAAQVLLPDGSGIAVLATTGLALDNDADSLAQGLVTLVQGGTPELALPAGVLADRVLAGLILLSVCSPRSAPSTRGGGPHAGRTPGGRRCGCCRTSCPAWPSCCCRS